MTEQALSDPFGLVGTTLDGQYRVDAVVGEGGFGVVYKGWHLALEQPIAIKALKVMDAEDPQVQSALYAKFKDEAKLLYTLSQASLHVVRSMDFGAVRSPSGIWAPYMILEWLEGCSLAEDLEQRRRRGLRGRSVEEALQLMGPAAEGLGVAHQRRVAHRDVKPANFFVLGDTSGARLKVLDFGIAKVLRDSEQSGTKSKFASFTWAYAAPEQLDPRLGPTGLATDVYSFALVLTELLTDRAPVEVRDVITLIKIATDPAVRPSPRSRGANVPEAIEAACQRALAVDPRARFSTIGEFWAALTAARSARSVTLAAPSSAAPSVAPQPVASQAGSSPMQHAPSAPVVPVAPGGYGAHAASAPPMPPQAFLQSSQQVPPRASGVPAYGAYPPAQRLPIATPPPMPSPFTGPPPFRGPVAPGQWARPRMIPTQSSSMPVILTVIAIVLGGLFVATCAAVHAACG